MGPEWKDVLVAAAQRASVDAEMTAGARVRDLYAVGIPRRCCRHAVTPAVHHEPLTALGVDGPQPRRAVAPIGRALALPVARHERDLPVVRRPARHRAVPGADAPQLSGRDRQFPDRRDAAEPVRREGDARAVVRPRGLAVVELASRERPGIAAVAPDHIDVPAPIVVPLEGDGLAVRRPRGQTRFEQLGRNSFRLAPTHRQDPQAADEIDRNPLAIGRRGRRHRCAFGQREIDLARGREVLSAAEGERQSCTRGESEKTTINAEPAGHAELLLSWWFPSALGLRRHAGGDGLFL